MVRRKNKLPKSLSDQLGELEHHSFLLHEALKGLASGEGAHVRHIAAELRTLVCMSSGTEGLLWRLAERTGVSDEVELHWHDNVDTDHADAEGLVVDFAPLRPPGQGDPRLPIKKLSLCHMIKNHHAIFIDGQGVTHEELIKMVAQQMGSAHEDDGIGLILARINSCLVDHIQSFFSVFASDSILCIQVAERLLTSAHEQGNYERRRNGIRISPAEAQLLSHPPVREKLPGPNRGLLSREQGAISTHLQIPHDMLNQKGASCVFPVLECGEISLHTTLDPDGYLLITIRGLAIPEITCKIMAPELDERGLEITITWEASDIKVYVNRELRESFRPE